MGQAARKILFFWIHLCSGVLAGSIVLLMSVTGVLLTYERQMIAGSDSHFRVPPQTAPVSMERILAQHPTANTVTLYPEPGTGALVALGRAGNILVNPYSGEKLGAVSPAVRERMTSLRSWHRWVAMEGPNRPLGKSITGIANLAFLVLVMTGAYLWLPAVFSARHFRAILWFRRGLSGKARDFNWHNVIGIWCLVPLFLIVISGVVIGYTWASNLVLSLDGPVKAAPQPPPPTASDGTNDWSGIDRAIQEAMRAEPAWRTISLRVPTQTQPPLAITVDTGTGGQPQKRRTMIYDRAKAQITKWESFENLGTGRQWRNWLRFVHTGEYYGIVGQTIAGIATLGTIFLVWTGIALSLRRWSAWRKRSANA